MTDPWPQVVGTLLIRSGGWERNWCVRVSTNVRTNKEQSCAGCHINVTSTLLLGPTEDPHADMKQKICNSSMNEAGIAHLYLPRTPVTQCVHGRPPESENRPNSSLPNAHLQTNKRLLLICRRATNISPPSSPHTSSSSHFSPPPHHNSSPKPTPHDYTSVRH